MNKLEWDVSSCEKVDAGGYLDGGQILSTICPPPGYVIWATTDIEECSADIVIWGYGKTEEEAKEDLWMKINRFLDNWNY